MKTAIASVATLLLGVAILLAGQGLQTVLLPVRATLEQFSSLGVGFIGAFYFLGFTFGCWKGSELLRRAGHVRAFGAMTAIASAVPLLHGLWVNLWTWGVMRFATGFCFAVLYVVIESWLNERASDENRGTVFSVYIVINMFMIAAGQQLLLLADPAALELFAVASMLVSLAAVPVLMSRREEPQKIQESYFSLKMMYRNSPTGMVGTLASGMANGAFWALAPVFAVAVTQDVSMAAWFMSAVVLGGAAGQWPLGWWSDRIDRRIVLIVSCAGAAVVGVILWHLATQVSPLGILCLGFFWGAFAFPVYSVSVAQANDRADPGTFVMISSGLLLMYGIGAVAGPFLSSGLMMLLGDHALFLYAAAAHLALAGYIGIRMRTDRVYDEEDHREFSDSLTSALTTSQVYTPGSDNPD
ncbi:MAG TPA: MFS transporter [Xanthomonadales bacterium]|nr:MFS transporter [Xanthomonadales bacterium]